MTGIFSAATITTLVVIIIALLYLVPVGLWLQAQKSGAPVGIVDLIGMRFRKVPPSTIVQARIMAHQAVVPLNLKSLEAHYMAGGHVTLVVQALVSADRAGIGLNFQRAAAIDLAGRNVLEAVKMSVLPRVITTPKITAMAKDGIQVSAYVKVTVRANLDRLVGGATEETILARVGEGVVTTIGSADSHKKVLENPDDISKNVLTKGLDQGTAFEIQSIDIADVDVGANIGAKLQIEQAEADKQIAQARAESRRALAVAEEQEMLAKINEMRAKVVAAEALVPKGLANALESGNLGAFDYFQMKNVVADTSMRSSIGKSMGGSAGGGGEDEEQV
ncbi:MAG: flotillin-like protein FloA [Myxococcota bacterium]|nr:flotillin-like protein FloA [Myxococcota bacterium]